MAVIDPVFQQRILSARKRVRLTTHHGIARVPVQCQVARFHTTQRDRGLATDRGIAREFALQNQQHIRLRSLLSSFLQHVVDRRAIGSRIVDAPEVKAPNFVCF